MQFDVVPGLNQKIHISRDQEMRLSAGDHLLNPRNSAGGGHRIKWDPEDGYRSMSGFQRRIR